MKGQLNERRFERVPTSNPILVERIGPKPEVAFALTKDVGLGGCSIVVSEALGLGASLKLYLSLGTEVIEAGGRIVHERPRPDGRSDAGIEYLQMSEVHRSRYRLNARV